MQISPVIFFGIVLSHVLTLILEDAALKYANKGAPVSNIVSINGVDVDEYLGEITSGMGSQDWDAL